MELFSIRIQRTFQLVSTVYDGPQEKTGGFSSLCSAWAAVPAPFFFRAMHAVCPFPCGTSPLLPLLFFPAALVFPTCFEAPFRTSDDI